MRARTPIAVVAAAGFFALGSIGGAVAAGQIGSRDIADNSIRSMDLRDGVAVGLTDLKPGLSDLVINGPDVPEPAEGASGLDTLESDGPYPGATQLQDGENSTSYWSKDGVQRSWVKCPVGKVALGGGFRLGADASLADKQATQVFSSQPVQVENGSPDAYSPIAGDADGSYVPNAWLVEGTYSGDNPNLVVRPHAICA